MDVEDAEDYNTDDGTCFGKVCCFMHRATDLINMLFYTFLAETRHFFEVRLQ